MSNRHGKQPGRHDHRLGHLQRQVLGAVAAEPMTRKALGRRCGRVVVSVSSFYGAVRSLIERGLLRKVGEEVMLTEEGEKARRGL